MSHLFFCGGVCPRACSGPSTRCPGIALCWEQRTLLGNFLLHKHSSPHPILLSLILSDFLSSHQFYQMFTVRIDSIFFSSHRFSQFASIFSVRFVFLRFWRLSVRMHPTGDGNYQFILDAKAI